MTPQRQRWMAPLPLWAPFLALSLGLVAPYLTAEEPPQVPAPAADLAAQVDHLVAATDRALAAGDWAEAGRQLDRAELVAAGAEPVRQRRRLLDRILAGGGDLRPVGDAVEAELAAIEYRVALAAGERAARAGDHAVALGRLEAARLVLDRFPTAGDAGDWENLRARVETLLLERERQQRAAAADDRAQAHQEATDRALAVEQRAESAFQARIGRVVDMERRDHLERALNHARRLVRDHPGEARAEHLYRRLLERVHERRELDYDQRRRDLDTEIVRRIHDQLVPTGIDRRPEFPDDWRQRDQRRGEIGLGGEIRRPQWEEALLDRLQDRISVDFTDIDPVEALGFVANRTGINLVVDAQVRATPNPPITIRAAEIRIDHLINWITRLMGQGWDLRHQAVFVGDPGADEAPVVRIYDVTEIVYRVNSFAEPTSGIFQGLNGGNGGGDLFGIAGGEADIALSADDLIDLLTTVVMPRAWDEPDNGIRVKDERYLVVTAPPRVHVQVREFIESQRLSNQILVNLELRWVELSDNWAEEIGVDWRNLGMIQLPQNPLGNDYGFYRPWSEGQAVGAIVNQLPGIASDLATSTALGGLEVQLLRIASTQVSAMLRAIELKDKGRILNGIELTCVNGQSANAYFLDQTSYIANYDPGSGAGDGDNGGNALEVTIETVNAGTVLHVRPVVSADRTFVTLDLRPVLSRLQLQTESFNAVVAGQLVQYQLELPNLELYQAGTRVMIPDQGTILVGGFDLAVDESVSSHVPLLGHIPYLGRLFGVRGQYSQHYKLYVMATVRIILYDEEEEFQ